MATVRLTSGLQKFFPKIDGLELEGESVYSVLRDLEFKLPELIDYFVDENGQLKNHVNIWLRNEKINDRERLTDKVHKKDELFISQSLSGG